MKKNIYIFRLVFLATFSIFLSSFIVGTTFAEVYEQIENINIPKDIAGIDKILKGLQSADGLIYQVGNKGSGVRELQNLLIKIGYSSIGKADGAYGNKTATAVSEFQDKNELTVTGKADLLTQFYLITRNSSFNRKEDIHIAQVENYAMIIWPDKAFYIGALDKSGNFIEGTYYYLSGCYYAGEYKNNLRSGKGTAHFTNGDVYIGQWKNDTMHGYGTYYYGGLDSTEHYKGNMSDNTMNGKGTYYLNGRQITGKWSNNRHVSWK